MLKVYCLCTALLTAAVSAQAQTAEDSVKAVISKLFIAMKDADGAALKSCFTDSAILQTTLVSKTGEVSIRTDDLAGFIDYVGKSEKGAADEQITFDMIRIDGLLATAWTPYKFYFKGQFSHCGVDAYQLVRIKGQWKIHYLIDTRRKTGCD